MPKDSSDRETFEDGTAYRFGPGAAAEAPSEEATIDRRSTAELAEESAPVDPAAPVSTQPASLVRTPESATLDQTSETERRSESGQGATLMNSPRPGDLLFGRYKVERLLGRGGMGEVWLVRHQILRDRFALKLIVPGAVIDDETVKRFVLEAQVMRALSRHPHAVVVHDADIDVERHVIYIVMDVVHGRSIDKRLIPGEAMSLAWTTRVLGQLCDVLHHAHERGIVHRDLSPANLMLEDPPDGPVHLRVLDFGIAKVLDPESGVFDALPLTEHGRFFGKRSYASPEQLNGERVDARSDLYSIGVILYEFLTGFRPYKGGPAQLVVAHNLGNPPRFATINPHVDLPIVEQVVRRCLAKNPDDRPQTALELFDLFRAAVLETDPSAASEFQSQTDKKMSAITGDVPPMPPAPSSWPIRKAALIGTATLVSLALAILVTRPPRVGTAPSPPIVSEVRPEVLEFFKTRELRPVAGTGIAASGFARIVERVADHQRLVWHHGVYLPEGHEPDLAQGRVGFLPRALVRKDGTRFVLIEGGDFVMGAFDPDIKDFCDEEKPGHRVELSSFYIQQTEVTCGEFDDFCKVMARDKNDPSLKDGFYYAWATLRTQMNLDEARKHPAVGVTRKLAEAYARDAGGELPSEAQWEFAARSHGKNHLYVWGNSQQFPNYVNIKRPIVVGIETRPVGLSTDDRTAEGVSDLAGNVREWCRDVWKVYPQVEPARDPVQGPAGGDASALYVIRGGSYDTDRETARTTWRADLVGKPYRVKNDDYDLDLGFRVVLEILEVPANLIASSASKAGAAGERAP
jgi:eukaryotic-like serine/threonine-protein kinase